MDGLAAERAQLQAERKAKMDALQAQAQQLKDFMSDGQLTQDELNKLPADSPFRKLTNLMADGKITTDELKSIGRDSASVAASVRLRRAASATSATATRTTTRLLPHRAPPPAADEPSNPRSPMTRRQRRVIFVPR